VFKNECRLVRYTATNVSEKSDLTIFRAENFLHLVLIPHISDISTMTNVGPSAADSVVRLRSAILSASQIMHRSKISVRMVKYTHTHTHTAGLVGH
jgi:hypothetical protein